jgi:hypothetical protein
MIKHKKPTTIAECVDGIGFVTRRVAIWRMNEYTIKTDEQHDIVRLKEPQTGEMMWFVYNRVPVEHRTATIQAAVLNVYRKYHADKDGR